MTKKELLFAIASIFLSLVFLRHPLASCTALAALCVSRTSFLHALWSSLACGLVLDLVASDLSFGLFALIFTLTTATLWKKRSLFPPLFAFIFNLLVIAFLSLLGKHFQITWALLLVPPLYAFFFLMLPMLLLFHRKKAVGTYHLSRPK
ncbi:MAG: hypothetical protein JSR80_01055 [Verrucomicrobia bacterium]|nr:hypothetical protein [Verrucomicrobiota bacterium]